MNEKARLLRRREAVLTLAGLGLTGALGARASGVLGTPAAEAATTCVLSPEVTEGPYWIDNHLTRRDITDGRPGLPLELVLAVQDAKTCTAVKGADVELWHCDAVGVYSGYESGSAGAPGGQHAVYRHAPYKSHGQPDTSHAEDMIYAQAGRSRATLKLTRRSNGRKGYRGTITLGVAT
jgi:hypothetical protein